MSDATSIEKPLDEWILGPKNQHVVVLWANGDVLLYTWNKGRLGGCLAAYRWTGGRLRNVIGGMDTTTEARISREVQERWKSRT
jgi:hypothetical protein